MHLHPVASQVMFFLLFAAFHYSKTVSPSASSVRFAVAICRLWIISNPDSLTQGQPVDSPWTNLPDFFAHTWMSPGNFPSGSVQPDRDRRLLAELVGQPSLACHFK